MFEYIRSTNIYKKISYYGFFYSVIAVIIYFAIPRGFGGLLIFIPFSFLHFAVGLLFISGIIAANNEKHNIPISTDWIYDIAFVIDFIVILGPLLIFLLLVLMSILGIIH